MTRAPLALTLCVVGLSGCGSFDSAKSGDRLIHEYVGTFAKGKLSVTSVKCPGGVSEKAGHTYNCAVLLRDRAGGSHRGVITIQMVSGNKVSINGSRDVHVR